MTGWGLKVADFNLPYQRLLSSRNACVSVVSLCSTGYVFALKSLEHWFLGGLASTSLHGQGWVAYSHLLAFSHS